jgi:hypothetical protein
LLGDAFDVGHQCSYVRAFIAECGENCEGGESGEKVAALSGHLFTTFTLITILTTRNAKSPTRWTG